MPSKLSALLVQDRVVSFRQMDAAVQRRRQRGGRTGTNLLELGYVEEDLLLYYLSKQRQVPAVERTMFETVPAEALQLWPKALAEAHQAVPLGLFDDLLQLAVVDPLPDEVIATLRAKHDVYVEQFVTLELRYWQAMQAFYDAEIDERWTRLIDQYPIPMGVGAPPPPVAPRAPVRAPLFETGEHGVPALDWSVEELVAFLDEADDRDEMLVACLGFVGKFFRRRLLFVVGRTSLRGYALQMNGEAGGAVNSLELPFTDEEPIGQVIAGGSYFLGPDHEIGLSALYDGLQISAPAELAVMPIRVGPRAALVLVADNADGALDPRSLPVLFLIANRLSGALERLIRVQKLRRSQAVDALSQAAIESDRVHRERTTAAPAVSEQATSIIEAVDPVERGLHKIPDDGWDLPEEIARISGGARVAPGETKPAQHRLDTARLAAHSTTRPLEATGDEPAVDAQAEAEALRAEAVGPHQDADAALHEEGVLDEAVPVPGDDEATHIAEAPREDAPTNVVEAPDADAANVTAGFSADVAALEADAREGAAALPTPGSDGELVGRTYGYEARARATGDMAIVGFRRREEESAPYEVVPSVGGGPIDLDVRLPGVLQPPQVREPTTERERAFAQSILDAPHAALIDKLTSEDPETSDAAFVELLNRGIDAGGALMDAFPGPLVVDRRSSRAVRSPKPLEKHGPVVWLIALQLGKFIRPLRAQLGDDSADTRYYAARLLLYAGDPDAVAAMVGCLFDRDDQVRATALRYLERHLDESRHAEQLGEIRKRLDAREAWVVETAISALQELKDVGAVPQLVEVLEHTSDRTRQKASLALARLTFQDHGESKRRWERWHRKFGENSRNDWLLAAMVDREWKVRDNAARELRRLPIVVNYNADLDKRARQTAQRAVHHYLFGRSGGP